MSSFEYVDDDDPEILLSASTKISVTADGWIRVDARGAFQFELKERLIRVYEVPALRAWWIARVVRKFWRRTAVGLTQGKGVAL